jgi:hypothetical protein
MALDRYTTGSLKSDKYIISKLRHTDLMSDCLSDFSLYMNLLLRPFLTDLAVAQPIYNAASSIPQTIGFYRINLQYQSPPLNYLTVI